MSAEKKPTALPAFVGLGALLLLAAGGLVAFLLLSGGEEKEEKPPVTDVAVAVTPERKEDPLDGEAKQFYEIQEENMAAGRYREVVRSFEVTAGRYDTTRWGVKIKSLADRARDRLAEKDATALVARAREYRRQGVLEKAFDKLVQAVELAPGHKEAKRELEEVRRELAAKGLTPGEVKPNIEPLLASARTFHETGLYDKAIDSLTEVLKADPDNVRAKQMLAAVREEQAEKQSAAEREAQFKKWMDEGLRLRVSRRFQEASEAFSQAAAFAPGGSRKAVDAATECRFEHFRSRAAEADEKGNLEAAVASYSRALEIREDAATRRALASAKERLGKRQQDEAKSAEAQRWRSRAEEAEGKGNLQAALGFYREAAKLGAEVENKIRQIEADLAYGDSIAEAQRLIEGKEWSRAAHTLESVLRTRPGDAKATSLLEKVTGQLGPPQAPAAPAPPATMRLDLGGGMSMDFAYIKPGTFMMGSEAGNTDERPVHEVRISRGFYVGKYEVTMAQYYRVMGMNIRTLRTPTHPAQSVSWQDANMFCQRLTQVTRKRVRLPTEAEWEYACRAGSTGRYHFGDSPASLAQYAWFKKNSMNRTQPAGQKHPNPWGLHDMLGNVSEWCSDVYDQHYYATSPPSDPRGPQVGAHRSLRGGCAYVDGNICTCSTRYHYVPTARNYTVGLRVVVEAPQ